MKCPNCNAEIFKEDRFCGECGHNLSNVARTSAEEEPAVNRGKPEPDPSESDNNNQPSTPGQGNEKTKAYFTEVISFFKSAILSPGRSIGRPHNSAVVAGTVALILLISSLVAFIQMRVEFGDIIIPFDTLFGIIISTAILYGVFYAITYLLIIIVIRKNKQWENVFNDFSIPIIIVGSLFILASLFNMITLYEIGLLVALTGIFLLVTAPIYLMLRYSENNNIKLDSFYSIIIYFLLVSIIFYIIGRIIIGVYLDGLLYELQNLWLY